MSAKEMQIEFERRIQLISPDLIVDAKPTSDTVFSFLNAAQDRYVVINYIGDDQLTINTHSFNKNVDAIKSLLIEEILEPAGITANGFIKFELPTQYNKEYFLYVTSSSTVEGTYKEYTDATLVTNQFVRVEDLKNFVTTAYNSPIIRFPGAAVMSDPQTKVNYLIVAADRYTELKNVVLSYYRRPLRFNVIPGIEIVDQCELPETVHSEIVDLAVDMFITEAKYRLNVKDSE